MSSALADVVVEDASGVDLSGGDLGLEEAQILLGGGEVLGGGSELGLKESTGLIERILDHHVSLRESF